MLTFFYKIKFLDMAFEAPQQQIGFLLGKKIYRIPRNQRKYVDSQ